MLALLARFTPLLATIACLDYFVAPLLLRKVCNVSRHTLMTRVCRLACLGSDALRFWLHYCRVTVVGASRSALDLHPLMLPASPCLASLSFSLTESILAFPQEMSSTIVK
jgi:hypothetical protein